MPSYAEESLVNNEHIVYEAHLSLWPFLWHIIIGSLLIVAPYFVDFLYDQSLPIRLGTSFMGLALFGYVYIIFVSTELIVTNRRVIVKVGVVSRNTSELYLNRVEGVEVDQSVSGRMLNYGTVFIRGVGTEITPVSRVSAPLEFRRQFFEAADKLTSEQPDRGYAG